MLILTVALSENGNRSRLRDSAMQGFSNARDAFQESFCYLRPMHLESSVMDAQEEYVNFVNCISQTPMFFELLNDGGGCFREKKLNC